MTALRLVSHLHIHAQHRGSAESADEILRFDPSIAASIGWRPYAVERASAVEVAAGDGEAHVSVVYFEAGGVIGPHEAGFGQLLLPISGSGWVVSADGERVALVEGEAAFIPRGEFHSRAARPAWPPGDSSSRADRLV